MECNPDKCELLNLRNDFGLYRITENYEPKQVECLELSRSCDNSGLGCLYFRGVFLCDTLENPAYLMPFGIYQMRITYSPKFKSELPEIYVPKHSGVRIHAGNYVKDSKGCVLVGVHSFVEPILSHSKLTLERVIHVIKQCNINYFKFA